MRDSWEIRFEWIQTILQWVSLAVGIALTFLQLGVSTSTMAASVAVTGYTIAMQFIPLRNKKNELVGGLLALLGVVTSLFAIAITGGMESGFLVYLAVPVFFAAAFHGTILGVLTTMAAIAGLVGVATTSGTASLPTTLPLMVVFYALIGITFTQARRILIEDRLSSPEAVQLQRLESAHHLLGDLADLASTAELNPVTVGRGALRDLAVAVPFSAGSISIIDDPEEITVATRGHPGSLDEAQVVPISMSRDRVGYLRLWSQDGNLLDPYASDIDRTMQPVALAFANVLLLQSIAHRAVREERVRLARELHDEIGPSLVSVGLGLDLALVSGDIDDDSRRQIAAMRETIGEIVEEVRTTVTHLRSADTTSLLEHAHTLAADTPADGPSFVIDIVEEGDLRQREAAELAAIMTEAVRNAVEHASASVVRIEGKAGRDQGEFCVCDNGHGMDPEVTAGQRYGVIGMRERAATIGAELTIESTRGKGTQIFVRWGSP